MGHHDHAGPVKVAVIFSVTGEASGDNAGAVAGAKCLLLLSINMGGSEWPADQMHLIDNKSTERGVKAGGGRGG